MNRSRNFSWRVKIAFICLNFILLYKISSTTKNFSVSITENLNFSKSKESDVFSVLSIFARMFDKWHTQCSQLIKAFTGVKSYRIVSVSSTKRFSLSSSYKNSYFLQSWPVQGYISSRFGPRRHPITRRKSFHNGIDIKAKAGTPVFSPVYGRVIFCRYAGANGNLVKIQTSAGYVLSFAHLRTFYCEVGQIVRPGQKIGAVGRTGRTTGPHLHFAIEKNGKYIDPLRYLGKK